MNLPDVLNPNILTLNFQSNDMVLINKTLYALDKKFKARFNNYGKSICKKWKVARNNEYEIINAAYSSGLYSFFKKIQQHGFEDRGVSVEFLFSVFFKNILLGELKKMYRNNRNITDKDPDEIFRELEGSFLYDAENEREGHSHNEVVFSRAYQTLKANCRNLIEFRKLLRLKNEEIASKLGLQAGSVNNEVYKCMEKLKKTVEVLRSNKQINPLFN